MNKIILFFAFIVLFFSCGDPQQQTDQNTNSVQEIQIPAFNADSAYAYIDQQVKFGPRVPGTEESKACALYLLNKMKSFGLDVQIQQGKVRAWNGELLDMQNIIASYNPAAENRLLLCAHWDTRPYADWDADAANHKQPILGANDGASGVGVLMEIARTISQYKPSMGVDFIFFDCEDYGKPKWASESVVEHDWCLGSQYWATNPHVRPYTARFGILLDMVGAKNAVFPMEGTSMRYAPEVMKSVWEKAHSLGYQSYFSLEKTGEITDDHLYVNQILNIPTIDIIHIDADGQSSFFEHWHTVNDDMSNIDKATLQAVGRTLVDVVYKGL